MILSEQLSFNEAKLLVESGDDEQRDGRKKLFMSGIFIQGGVKNLNGRVYPVSEIRNAVDHINQQISEGYSICGECDHPSELTVNIDRISHSIEKMWMDGNSGFGKLKILPTPMGNIIRTLIEADVKLGVSSRGSGNVDERGNVDSFEIITVDVVMRPSAPNAYPKPVFEAKHSKRGGTIMDLAEAVRHDPKAQKYLKSELLTWINNLK